MNIVTYPNKILNTSAEKVEIIDEDTLDLINEMYTILKQTGALGLAAPQVGVLKNIIVWDKGCSGLFGSFQPMALINPVIVSNNVLKTAYESCLSLGDAKIPVSRFDNISVSFSYPKMPLKTINAAFNGLRARIIQHEIDHLNGKTLLDHLGKQKKSQPLFEEQVIIVEAYK